jgi:dihydropteroate synthase
MPDEWGRAEETPMADGQGGNGPTAGPAVRLRVGERSYDISHRALIMGILNRTTDSFYDRGAHFQLDDLLRRAEQLFADGTDLLDVGARAAGVGTREVSEAEETDLIAETVTELRRLDVPLSVDTWRASVAAAAFAAGAVIGNDLSGFSDPGFLPAAAASGATVVATHIRLAPRVPDPDPIYGDVVADVAAALARLAACAESAGIPSDRILVDPGLDLGKTWRQSTQLLAGTARFAALGYPVLLAPSNKIFLGRLLGLELQDRGNATVAACAVAAARGARVLRVHDAGPARQAADLVAAVLALDGAGP